MPIEITGLPSTPAQKNNGETVPVLVARSEPTVAQNESGRPLTTETVTLTDLAQQLHALSQSTASQPVVDVQRVEKVKQALLEGSYDFSAERVAEKLLRFEEQLAH